MFVINLGLLTPIHNVIILTGPTSLPVSLYTTPIFLLQQLLYSLVLALQA